MSSTGTLHNPPCYSGLIHANGRVYDPQLGRFLSVDPVFAFPTNTQSLNPYSYVLNNPLSNTDPTGYNTVCIDQMGCVGGEGNRDAKGNLFSKDAQQIGDMKNGTKATIGAFTVSKDADGNVAISNGGSNGASFAQGASDAQNKPTESASIGGPSTVAKSGSTASADADTAAVGDTGHAVTDSRETKSSDRDKVEKQAESDLSDKGLLTKKVDFINRYATAGLDSKNHVVDIRMFGSYKDALSDIKDTNRGILDGLTMMVNGKSDTSIIYASAAMPHSITGLSGQPVYMNRLEYMEFTIMHESAHGDGIVDERDADVDALKRLGPQ